jgi:hypothetical protein
VRSGREAVIVVSEDEYARTTAPRRNLVDLFSALRGSGLELKRDKGLGRDVEL